MTRAFGPFRLGHAAAAHHQHPKRSTPDPGCKTGGFYKTPTNGQTVNSSVPLNIAWDTTCLDASALDIYLYAPGSNQSILHMWQTVNAANGFYNATIQPNWWNSTSNMMLQLSIVASGTPTFLSPFPAGPVFTATATPPVDGKTSTSSGSGITTVNNMGAIKKPLSPGRTAAAVIMPLLVVALLIAVYIRWNRLKGKEQRMQFSVAVDKRMSTISTDWKSMSTAGASAAIRSSIAAPANRASAAFSFGAIRPASTYTVDGGQAGVGARGFYSHENASIGSNAPAMSQLRPGIRTSAFGERVSRVSFAADPRPSAESRRTITSRAFHSSFVPPLPGLPRKMSSEGSSPGTMSPTQTQGPLTLTPEDIRARIAGQEYNSNSGVDEVMPALSMMRTGGDGSGDSDGENDYLFDAPPSPAPQPPTPIHAKSPVGMMPMQPMPANVMSPDEMLRAYAERRAATGPGPAPAVSYPAPVANYNGNGMRTLYSPASPPTSPHNQLPPPTGATTVAATHEAQRQDYRISKAQTLDSRYSLMEEDAYSAYIGTAE